MKASYDIWHLDCCLTERRGVATANGTGEMILRNRHGIQNLCIDSLLLQIDEVSLLSDAHEHCFRAQLGRLRTDEAVH